MTKYVNTNFEIIDINEEYTLECEVDEDENNVTLIFTALACYFEDQLLEMGERHWPNRGIKIHYKKSIYLSYHSFRKFKEIVYGES